MPSSALTIVGLGPGAWGDLTRQAYDLLAEAASRQQTVYLRTAIHPLIEPLKQAFPTLALESFDRLYDELEDWEQLYQRIANEISARATQEATLYAVPGHPLVGDTTVQLLLQSARSTGSQITIVAGLSFLEPVYTALELDPLTAGQQIIDATTLAELAGHEIAGKIIPTIPLLVPHLYNRRLASAVKLALSDYYPAEWPVGLVRVPTETGQEPVLEMPLFELDHNNLPDYLTTLYVPPVAELSSLRLPETLRYITMRLRRDPDGCPWDREQTHQSLARYVLEEAYEVAETLEEENIEGLAEELGDLLLQVYLHSEIARQDGDFDIGDVFEHVNAKLIRRHPHVFGTTEVDGASQVVQNWEAIKRQERANAGTDLEQESALDRVPQTSPALLIAQEYQKRAAKLGFDYPDYDAILTKITEELQELAQAQTAAELQEEFGDLLFLVTRAARQLKIDAEAALRATNRKFRRRFQAMEETARSQGRELSTYTQPELSALWQQAKITTAQS